MAGKKTIIIGKSGSGKSHTALEMLFKSKGTSIILSSCTDIKTYIEDFPFLEHFTEVDGSVRPFNVKEGDKLFIANPSSVTRNIEYVMGLIRGYGSSNIGKNKESMVIFDDNSWARVENKLSTLWDLTYSKCQVVITCDTLFDILDCKLSKKQLKDIRRRWNIMFVYPSF